MMMVVVVVGSHVIHFWAALEELNKEELAELINFCSGRRLEHTHTHIYIYIHTSVHTYICHTPIHTYQII